MMIFILGEIVNLSKKIGKDVRKDVKNLDKSDEGWYNFVTKKERVQEGLHVGTRGVRRKIRRFVKFANNSHFL